MCFNLIQTADHSLKILALDTSTPACSVALSIDDDVDELFEITPRGHGQRVLAMADQLLAGAQLSLAQLDGLAFGRGPGAFTGVRIATSVVQGMAFGADLPVAPVSSLAALAQGVYRTRGEEAVLAAIDARMDEVYWGAYGVEAGRMVVQTRESVCAPADIPVPQSHGWFGAGSGWAVYEEALASACGPVLKGSDGAALPHARDVGCLARLLFEKGETVAAEQALPVYLRDNVVKTRSA